MLNKEILKNLVMPKKVEVEKDSLTNEYGRFIIEPLERGYGVTIGNALRRILLSSISGVAVTSVKIEGVLHEFSTIQGVVEDVTDIILSIKRMVLKMHGEGPKHIYIKTTGKDKVDLKGEVTAGDIITDMDVEVLNKDLHIATLDIDGKLEIDMEVERGMGFVLAEKNKKPEQPIGVIPVDSIFSPVRKVNYNIEPTRVGQIMDYDKLIVEVVTNGSISPYECFLQSTFITMSYFELLLGIYKKEEEEAKKEEIVDEKTESVKKVLNIPIEELDLSMRATNCLRKMNIKYLGELVQFSEEEMLKIENFGKKSLDDLKKKIDAYDLAFGMKVDFPVPEKKKELEALIKKEE